MAAASSSTAEYCEKSYQEIMVDIMMKFLATYWNLTLFKESPENTPYSKFLMTVAALCLILVMIIEWQLSEYGFSSDLLITSLIAATMVLSFILYTYAVLLVRKLPSRLIQTCTCLFFAHTFIHLCAFPLFVLAPYLTESSVKNPLVLFVGVLYLFVTLTLSVWQFLITAHIYKYALNTTALQSILVAFGLIAVNILTVSFWR